MQRLLNVLFTLLLLVVLIILFPINPLALLSQSEGIQPERTFRLLDALEPDYGLAYTAQSLHVQQFLVRVNAVYYLTRAVPQAGLPAALVRTDTSGKLPGITKLPESRVGYVVDADDEGNQYVVVKQDQSFRIYSPTGDITSARPVQAAIDEVCNAQRRILDICQVYNPVLRRQFSTWQRQIYPRHLGDGFLLVDGHTAQLHLGNDEAGITKSVGLSNPILDEARRKSDEYAARDPNFRGTAEVIGDATVYNDKIYLLMGDSTPLGKAYVMRYTQDAAFEAITEYALPTLPGTRIDPNCKPQPILPTFMEIAAGRLYICDFVGNVAVFQLEK